MENVRIDALYRFAIKLAYINVVTQFTNNKLYNVLCCKFHVGT